MDYRLSLAQPLRETIPAIALSQLDAAIEKLDSTGGDHTSIHAARRHFKRLRALLGLAKPLSRGKAAKIGQRRITSAARKLSARRDSQAVVHAAEVLERDFAQERFTRIFADLKSFLEARRAGLEEKQDTVDIHGLVQELKETKRELTKLKLDGTGIADLIGPAARTYRRGRHAMKDAAQGSGEAMHEWRKQVQRHRRHMLLLKQAWPGETKARLALAKQLAAELGLHHDLDVLREVILANRAAFRMSGDVKTLCTIIKAKQRRLEAIAFKCGESLYAEKPKALARRLKAHLETVK